MKLTKNFDLAEFACHDGTPVPDDLKTNVGQLAANLQVIREFFGAKITVISGYRTPAYNKSIKGADGSMHLAAAAADIVVEGHSASEVQFVLEGLMRIGAIKNGGLGHYSTFTHYDIGPTRRWHG